MFIWLPRGKGGGGGVFLAAIWSEGVLHVVVPTEAATWRGEGCGLPGCNVEWWGIGVYMDGQFNGDGRRDAVELVAPWLGGGG